MEQPVLSAIFLAVPQAILFVDNSGQNAWMNPKAAQILDLPDGSVLPHQIAEAMRSLRERTINRSEIESRWQLSLRTSNTPLLNWLWLFPDTARFKALEVSCVPTVHQTMKGRLWVFHDISELYVAQRMLQNVNTELFRRNDELEEKTRLLAAAHAQIEEQLALQTEQSRIIEVTNSALEFRNEQLKELNNEKNEILGIVAHDLKNPIGAVRGLAELLGDTTVAVAARSVVVEQIIQTSDRMLELVKNVLDMNRFDTSGVRVHAEDFDIEPFVQSIVEQYQHIAKGKHITVNYASLSRSSVVFADEQAVMQVLDNLLSNAVKYTPQGKQVFVRIAGTADMVRIEVQDEGPGLSEDDQTKLFGRFARLSARPTGGEHSTGLGLSIVKRIVEAMHGRVWCESELGKGAMFIVELPRSVSAE